MAQLIMEFWVPKSWKHIPNFTFQVGNLYHVEAEYSLYLVYDVGVVVLFTELAHWADSV